MNILIVDDNATDLQLTRTMLETEGHAILEAADGVEALAVLEREKVDVIISDVLMPRMDGYRFCYEVRASERFRHLPVILHTSGYILPNEKKLALEMGADHFVAKTSAASEFIRTVHDVATRQRAPFTPAEPSRELSLMKEYNQQLVVKLEQKNIELTASNQELLLSREQLLLQGTALDTAADAVVITDARGIILWVNPAFVALTGYAAEEAIGKTPRLLKSGQHGPDFYKNLWTTIHAGGTWRGNFTNRRKDGSLYHDEHTITPVRSKEGVITHFIAIMNDVTERIRAEESLKLFRTLIDHSNDAIHVIDPITGRFLDINETACRRLGYSREAMLLMSVADIVDVAGSPISLLTVLASPQMTGFKMFESRHRRKDGSTFPVEVNVQYANLDRGYLVTGVRDITERKQAEEARQATEARYRTLFEHAPDGIVIADPESTYLDANASMCRMLGYTRDELIGRNASDIVTPAEIQNIGLALNEIRTQSDHHREWQFRRKDGSVFAAEVIATMMPDRNLLGMIRDITERKRADEQIAEQAAFLDKAQDAILVRDLEGKILLWNKGAERMYGWTRQEAMGRDKREFLYVDPKKFEEISGLVISQGEWYGELQHLTKDRREITVEARWTLIRDNEGHPKSVLEINTDITERKEIEAQFMRAQRMESIGTLAGGIAHDLNNILAPILLSIDFLKITSVDPQARKILETIEVSAKRGADIVRQVLSFARGLEGQRIEVQPKHLLKDLENIIKDTFPKDIQLRFSIPNDTWTILGDPTQVHQILLNLCVNGRDAMPNGGNLTIHVENCVLDEQYAAMNIEAKPGRYVRISVTDSGTGMPPALLDKIFEPFFTTKELHKGTGLGLSTVMAIVKSHGGSIDVYSEPGKGTTFKVYLPAMEHSSEARQEQSEEVSLPRGNGETVLVIDDEASILAVTSQTLQAFGYRILTATDGAEALAIYAEHKNEIDVVLTDMMMPILDGPATIHALMRLNPAVKIITASGLNASGGVTSMPGLDIKHVLTKPYTAETLLKILRVILAEAGALKFLGARQQQKDAESFVGVGHVETDAAVDKSF